jgi:hypothetical protein
MILMPSLIRRVVLIRRTVVGAASGTAMIPENDGLECGRYGHTETLRRRYAGCDP